jgi:hypothetical protein
LDVERVNAMKAMNWIKAQRVALRKALEWGSAVVVMLPSGQYAVPCADELAFELIGCPIVLEV